MADDEELLHRGIGLFNAGRFYESHEELEAAWNRAPRPERFFIQALIHCAAAWHHAARGNFSGAVLQARRASRKLAGYLPGHRGIDTRALLPVIQDWLEAWQRSAPAPQATIGLRR